MFELIPVNCFGTFAIASILAFAFGFMFGRMYDE